ncbi:hypothetical protein CALVIDRAFT_568024 [Calocera viscosa TUFC12733]|uniref:Ribosomal protein S21 n=1 Tax=Calocera viscosa (strain TUFC12733) TaxID=1330018 RepID=A0A167HJP3_CALVF|nr:hypothetical protein CALVIDRAFT_568024 [Calocera viscosa TUFC12733]
MSTLLRQAIASSSRGFTPLLRTSSPALAPLSRRALSTTRPCRTDDDALSFPDTPSRANPVAPIPRNRTAPGWQQPPAPLYSLSPRLAQTGTGQPGSIRPPPTAGFGAILPTPGKEWTKESLPTVAEKWERRSINFLARRHKVGTPTSGRSVAVVGGELLKAYYRLSKIVTTNGIRTMWHRDQRHTPPSVLRRELRSIRHRTRYAEALRRKVQIVQKIRSIAR